MFSLRSAAAARSAMFRVPTGRFFSSSSVSLRAAATEYPKTFDKILIANRGEIACRVIRTAKKMGIQTVAVYSEADAMAQHVQMADEAVLVGPPPTSQSYLSIPNILSAIKKTGAQAVHPGYGFLSENFHFVEALDKAGVTFIGPSTKSMAMMGDKIESKRIALEAKVNTIPGFQGEVKDLNHALQIANDIGYPLMIKASAGGGGKGMRVVRNDQEVRDNFDLIKSESMASFGDDRLLIERFVDNPRHIEFQLIGDQLGNTVYLPERECSIQRRNQKVIEEAPSPHLDPATRKAMGEQAVALAKRVGYHSAGTVEFLVDQQRNFYFLEMNTRLQVEHPITELVTGYDLVEQMIRVAAGLPITMKQDDVKIHGHAFESRVYAEDPEKFLPSIGTLSYYVEPTTEGVMTPDLAGNDKTKGGLVRCDSGVEEGSEISIYYDPMICKACSWAPTREGAIQVMERALDAYVIKGVTHNIPLIRDVLAKKRFRDGKLSTGFLPEEYPEGFKGHKLEGQSLDQFVCVAAALQAMRVARQHTFSNYPSSYKWDPRPTHTFELEVTPAGKKGKDAKKLVTRTVQVRAAKDGKPGEFEVVVDAAAHPAKWTPVSVDWTPETPIVATKIANAPVAIVSQYSDPVALGFKLQHCGTVFDVKVQTPEQAKLSKFMKPKAEVDESLYLMAPMPGQVVSIDVKEGQKIAAGNPLAIVEAMKMQNVLRATRDVVVKKVLVKKGASVAADEVMIEFEPEKKA
ncbi:carbamoyl-phosphate synthase L chain, ATP binding domain-domain-containing protein [Catenaria anguillulae PL171]|uniref:Carbamoyl-phosphate synthase L chain, ATP binding domain-domain-containing protein n=1 Tax=Catenaria anguillulae PL171 TaxID=765915 RepID=A0A1Y2HRS3_9FUNG|nr:carbamoyl-phosphate synthase L chain, ATP binding domain-domain-containing protein [Catenaria anguillulae PL171]